jgi:hypothetical protein
MDQSDQRIIDSVRQRALLADQKRRALLEQRRELDSTISALAEVTALSKGEIENISADVQREVNRERSEHGRRPKMFGVVMVLAFGVGILMLAPATNRAPEDTSAHIPMSPARAPAQESGTNNAARVASPRPSLPMDAATAPTSPDEHLISGLSPESKVHVYGVYEGTLSKEDAKRLQAERHAAAQAFHGESSLAGTVRISTARRWTQIEKPRGIVTVQLPPVTHPIVLVLTAYESVNWIIVPAPGAIVEHVIVSGYEEQFVSGLPSGVPMTVFSPVTGNRLNFHAYKKQDKGYIKLVRELGLLTEKPIHQFRGAYKGDTFRANYRNEDALRSSSVDSKATTVLHDAATDEAPKSTIPDPSTDPGTPSPGAKIHKWVDDSGRVHYGDRPPPVD